MNAKNLIFRLVAVVFAVGGAIASVNAVSIGQAHLSYNTVGGAGFCSTIGNQCTKTGEFICKVTIRVNNVPTTVTAWDHQATGVCTATLTNVQAAPIVATGINKIIPPGATIRN
jgi:hypothetical protein